MSDVIVLTPELIGDTEKTVNFFNISDQRRKNKFILSYLQELFKSKIPIDKVLAFFRVLQQNETSFAYLLDNLYLCSLFMQQQSENKKLMTQLLHSIAERLTPAQKSVFFDYFDEETLWECQFVQQAEFQLKKRKVNTDINFIQFKFGLMKDENEGYSKLIVEIMEAASNQIIDESTEQRIENIVSLIGYFDLDPDRVVDLIVQSWIEQPYSLTYITILKQFKQTSVSQFLGKRYDSILQTLQNSNLGVTLTPLLNAATAMENDPRVPPQNLIIVTALGLKYHLFDTDQIWKYMQPFDKDLSKTYEEMNEDVYKYYKSFDQMIQVDELKDQTQSISTQADKSKKDLYSQAIYNQKLWLLQGLLQVNSFGIFMDIFKIYQHMIDLTQFIPLKKTMSEIIEWMIDPIYAKIFNNKFKSRGRVQYHFEYCSNTTTLQLKQFTEVNAECIHLLTEILSIFYPYIGEYSVTFHKLVKVLQTADFPQIQELVMDYLFPAIQSGESLPIVQELWQWISTLDFRLRYQYYSKWKDTKQFQTINQVVRGAELSKVHMRAFFNKIDKENKDRMTLKFAKITHNQPLSAMNQLRRNRLELSDNNNVVVHALNLATPLTQDIMMFTIVQWLCDYNDESKIKDKDIDCKQWFKNVAMFVASALRKYYTLDMQGLFTYLCEMLASTTTIIKPELVILRELIEKMTGIVQIVDLTPSQIQALAGGRYIQLETTAQTNEFRKSRKSSFALEQFFWTTTIKSQLIMNQDGQQEVVSLAFLLLVVLCQQRSRFLLNYHNSNLKPLSHLYDNFTWSINQLTKCLLFQSDKPTHYAQLFPKNPLHRMVIHFKIPFEIAFHIVRYGHKSLYNMTEDEFKEERDNIKKIFDAIEPESMYINPDINDPTIQQLPKICHTYSKENLWNVINPDLFSIFWLLNLDNIYVPVTIYEGQIKGLQENIIKSVDVKDRQNKYNQKAKEKLENELENNKKRKEQFDKFLLDKKDCLTFKDVDKESPIIFSQIFSQMCLLPRILIDAAEAIYCAKFIQTFLRIGKAKQTHTFYVPKEILYYTLTFLQCATEQEATNLSIFTYQMLMPFANWNDENKYRNDLKTYFNVNSDQYERERNYIIGSIFMKIQQFIKCLKANETQVRNSLIFLKRVQDIFPPTQFLAEQVKLYLQDVDREYGTIPDIKAQVRNYHIEEKILNLPNFQHKTTSAEPPKKVIKVDQPATSGGFKIDSHENPMEQQQQVEKQREEAQSSKQREAGEKEVSVDNSQTIEKEDSKQRIEYHKKDQREHQKDNKHYIKDDRDSHYRDRDTYHRDKDQREKGFTNGNNRILSEGLKGLESQKRRHDENDKSKERDLKKEKKKSYDNERGPKKQPKQ